MTAIRQTTSISAFIWKLKELFLEYIMLGVCCCMVGSKLLTISLYVDFIVAESFPMFWRNKITFSRLALIVYYKHGFYMKNEYRQQQVHDEESIISNGNQYEKSTL